jgi:hypothetical protein
VRRVLLVLLVTLGSPRPQGCWTAVVRTSENPPSARPVNRRPTIAYARVQEAGVPKACGLGRVKNILAASTRLDWEAHGQRHWVHKGDRQLRIVDLTDDEGRVELKEE